MSMYSTALTLLLTASMSSVQDPQPEVTIYRSWRAPNVTVVEGMFRVDPELLGTGGCLYGAQLTVRDQRGTELQREQWTGRCPEQDGTLSAALETFTFAITPATYTVEVTVWPQGAETRRRSSTVTVQGIPQGPLVSDLILAREVGFVDSANAGEWTMRRGDIGLRISSQLVISPDEPQLSYYLELYPPDERPMTGSVQGIVRRQDGRELARFKLHDLQSVDEWRPLAGSVSVAGLPPGAYSFETQVQLRDTTVVRTHAFYMEQPVVATARGLGWFYTLSDEQITELFDGIVVWLPRGQAEQYPSLPLEARREFLTREFGPEGPTPDDGSESALDAYLSRVQVVNLRFTERAGRSVLEPWRTPRGRIYLLRGQPSSQIARPSPQSGAPYEIWQYAVSPGYIYVFADESGLGHYRLLYSTDPAEQGVVDWTRRLGGEALEDLARMGIVPRSDQQFIPPSSGAGSPQ
jgi:GWxTD domain-containing protein